jgi:hypothetical protein
MFVTWQSKEAKLGLAGLRLGNFYLAFVVTDKVTRATIYFLNKHLICYLSSPSGLLTFF